MPENPLASRAGGPDPPVSGKNPSYLQALGSAVGKFRLYTCKTASFIFNGILKQHNLLCLPFVRGETSHAESEDKEPLTNPEEIDIDEDEDDEDENGATLLSLLLFS